MLVIVMSVLAGVAFGPVLQVDGPFDPGTLFQPLTDWLVYIVAIIGGFVLLLDFIREMGQEQRNFGKFFRNCLGVLILIAISTQVDTMIEWVQNTFA